MHIITPAQCRAARALLNWSQPDLATRCNAHVQTISNFEKESSTPTKTTLEKMMLAFTLGGVSLTENDGVKRHEGIITVIEGTDAIRSHLDNLYEDLKDKPGSEILISGLSEAKPDEELRSFVEMHIQRLIKANISERLLIEEGDTNLIAPKEWYRYIPKKHFSSTTFQLHGDKMAMHERHPTKRIVVIENKLYTEAYRKLFNFAWEHAKPA